MMTFETLDELNQFVKQYNPEEYEEFLSLQQSRRTNGESTAETNRAIMIAVATNLYYEISKFADMKPIDTQKGTK